MAISKRPSIHGPFPKVGMGYAYLSLLLIFIGCWSGRGLICIVDFVDKAPFCPS